VMENTQIYRTRLNGRTALLIDRDLGQRPGDRTAGR